MEAPQSQGRGAAVVVVVGFQAKPDMASVAWPHVVVVEVGDKHRSTPDSDNNQKVGAVAVVAAAALVAVSVVVVAAAFVAVSALVAAVAGATSALVAVSVVVVVVLPSLLAAAALVALMVLLLVSLFPVAFVLVPDSESLLRCMGALVVAPLQTVVVLAVAPLETLIVIVVLGPSETVVLQVVVIVVPVIVLGPSEYAGRESSPSFPLSQLPRSHLADAGLYQNPTLLRHNHRNPTDMWQ